MGKKTIFPLASWLRLARLQLISRRGSTHPLRVQGAAWTLKEVLGRYCISPLLVSLLRLRGRAWTSPYLAPIL